ncbi:MAG: leucine-rich repeat domain-containing protein [Clostridiales bacterium]|nr:leucine-rich repeat domain-containing protein [Clostridiales bacterium]
MAHQVFISYSHKDKKITDTLCHYLEQEKISCWIAPRDITHGGSWAGEISAAIPKTKIFLLIFSSSSNISKQVIREVEIAIHNGIEVIPIRIEDIMPSGDMNYFLASTSWIDVMDKKIENKISFIIFKINDILDMPINNKHITTNNERKKKKSVRKIIIGIFIILLLMIGTLAIIFRNEIPNIVASIRQLTSTPASTPMSAPSKTIEHSPKPTPEPVPEKSTTPQDYGLDPDMIVEIPDAVLRGAILQTLRISIGFTKQEITVRDIFNLEVIIVIHESEDWYTNQSFAALIYETTDIMEDFSGLEYAHNLKILEITKSNISDISPLSDLVNLESLRINESNISDIGALAKLINITDLNVRSKETITNFSSLKELTKLKYLTLDESSIINDFTVLNSLVNLEHLSLSSNGIDDINVFKELNRLKRVEELNLRANEISNISGINIALAGLTNLNILNLSDNKIKDISPLSSMKQLTELHLAGNEISDINALSELNLHSLSLIGNNIKDLSALVGLENLNILNIDTDTYNNNLETINLLKDRGCKVNIE